jgi:probable F420-dependent oxidoreductase
MAPAGTVRIVDLGRVGVWWSGSWRDPGDPDRSVAPALESLGYGALWSSGRFDPGLSPHFERLLAATDRIPVASGIVSIWAGAADDVGPAVTALESRFPDRFMLGVGASHEVAVADYTRPYSRMVAYLDALDALPTPVPAARRVLAALGPRMLELAAARAAGAHPYFVPVEHTAFARGVLGRGPLLAPEVAVVLESDPARARGLARGYASTYLGLPNYTGNLRRFGYGDEDIDGGGSDRLIDAVIPWGDAATVAAAVRAHHDAGADHVCVQVISDRGAFPLQEYETLAGVLLGP